MDKRLSDALIGLAAADVIIKRLKTERDGLLAACEHLCSAIKMHGQSQCNFNYDGPSLEFIEENWEDSELGYLLDVYREGQAAIAKAKGK